MPQEYYTMLENNSLLGFVAFIGLVAVIFVASNAKNIFKKSENKVA